MKNIALLILLISLPASGMSKKELRPPTTASPMAMTAADTDSIWVGKSDEAKLCAKEKGISLDQAAKTLVASEIKIFAKKKVPDGKMRIQMCGSDKGDMNGFLIARKDIEKAKELGFRPVSGSYQNN